jgi:hypothetical protein
MTILVIYLINILEKVSNPYRQTVDNYWVCIA